MKALVTGGNGFIGTNLVDGLLARGYEVRVFDRYPSRFKQPHPDVEYIVGDCGNHGEVHDVVQGSDLVFHLAYTTLPHTSNEDPTYDVRSNLIDTMQLLQECRQFDVRKVIFVSSGGTVYGIPKKIPIPEDHPTNPICSYGITKLAIEKYLQLFYRLWGLDYAIARISNPYGEQQNPVSKQGAVGVFLGNALQGKPITIWGDGGVVRDYIYIADAVNALIAAAEKDFDKEDERVFNVGAGRGWSLNQIVEEMRQTLDCDINVIYTESRPEDVPVNVLDIERAGQCLQWQPAVDMHDGLNRTWRWLKTLAMTKA